MPHDGSCLCPVARGHPMRITAPHHDCSCIWDRRSQVDGRHGVMRPVCEPAGHGTGICQDSIRRSHWLRRGEVGAAPAKPAGSREANRCARGSAQGRATGGNSSTAGTCSTSPPARHGERSPARPEGIEQDGKAVVAAGTKTPGNAQGCVPRIVKRQNKRGRLGWVCTSTGKQSEWRLGLRGEF